MDVFKESFQFVDSHDWNGDYFFAGLGVDSAILVVFAVVHFVEVGEKIGQFIADVVVAEDKDLIVRPDVVEGGDEMVWIFADFFDVSELGGDIAQNKALNIFPDIFVDLYFFPGARSRFGQCKIIDDSR